MTVSRTRNAGRAAAAAIAATVAAALLTACQDDGPAAAWQAPAGGGASAAADDGGSTTKADVCTDAKRAMDEGKAAVLALMFKGDGAEPEEIRRILVKTGDGLRAAAVTAADADLKSTLNEVADGFAKAGRASDPAGQVEKTIPPLEERFTKACG